VQIVFDAPPALHVLFEHLHDNALVERNLIALFGLVRLHGHKKLALGRAFRTVWVGGGACGGHRYVVADKFQVPLQQQNWQHQSSPEPQISEEKERKT
jgi:hypothetical protein